jgi:hypothetical protein
VKELEKLRNNNLYIKQQTQKIYDNWLKTELIKEDRIKKEANFIEFMTNRIRNHVI